VFAVAAIFVVLALFWALAVRLYEPGRPPAAQNEAPDHLAKDLAWKATPQSRRAYLAEMRKHEVKQATEYGWVDQNAGVVQLPIERAMELIAQENGGGK
jgi:hypothetical protein